MFEERCNAVSASHSMETPTDQTPTSVRWIDSPNAKGPIARMQNLWKSSLYFSSEEGAFHKFMEEFDLSGLKIPYPCPCSHEDFVKGLTAADQLIDMLKKYQNEEFSLMRIILHQT